MSANTPDPLDVLAGARIRIFRIHRGMSQSDLAAKIGVAFQQVQKYEEGTNRIGAGRLSRIAAVLGISVGELFESYGSKPAELKSPFRLLAERDALRVLMAFSRMTDPRMRRAVAQLVEIVADLRPAVKPSLARPAAVKRLARRRPTTSTQG